MVEGEDDDDDIGECAGKLEEILVNHRNLANRSMQHVRHEGEDGDRHPGSGDDEQAHPVAGWLRWLRLHGPCPFPLVADKSRGPNCRTLRTALGLQLLSAPRLNGRRSEHDEQKMNLT